MLHVVRLFWSRLKRFNKCCWNVKWNKWMNERTNEWSPPWISGRMHERRPERVNLFSVRMRVRWERWKVGKCSILSHLVHHPHPQRSENNVSIVLVYKKNNNFLLTDSSTALMSLYLEFSTKEEPCCLDNRSKQHRTSCHPPCWQELIQGTSFLYSFVSFRWLTGW